MLVFEYTQRACQVQWTVSGESKLSGALRMQALQLKSGTTSMPLLVMLCFTARDNAMRYPGGGGMTGSKE